MTLVSVFGNAARDLHINGDFKPDRDQISIHSAERDVVLNVVDGPFQLGHKHRIAENIDDIVDGMDYEQECGGGGFNSVMAIRGIAGDGVGLTYMDVSNPDPLFVKALEEAGIDHVFSHYRSIPTNLVMGGKGEKLLLKGPNLERLPMEYGRPVERMRETVAKSDSVLVNSGKDENYVDELVSAAVSYDRRLFFVATDSMSFDFCQERMIPNGTVIMNYEDLHRMMGHEGGSHDDKKTNAVDFLRQINGEAGKMGRHLYITLGGEGTYCSDGKIVYHIGIEGRMAEQINKSVVSKTGSTNGAGDVFAGAATYLGSVLNGGVLHPTTLAKIAQTAAIKHIGYRGALNDMSFFVNEVKS